MGKHMQFLRPLLFLAAILGLLCILLPAVFFRDSEFDAFLRQYGKKHWRKEEYDYRLKVYHDNIKRIAEFNSSHSGVSLQSNQFADLTQEEFRRDFLSPIQDELSYEVCQPGDSVPESVDWTTTGAVHEVQDQGNSQSSVPLVVAAAIEAAYFVKTGTRVKASVQQLIDCVGTTSTYDDYFEYIKRFGGLLLNANYTPGPNSCDRPNPSALFIRVSGYQDAPRGDQLQLKLAVAMQPLAVAVEADEFVFQFYSKGVIASNCGENVDHAVLLVGYGVTAEGQKYWKIQNSWGTTWGEAGYAYILRRDSTADDGVCGIADIATYPILP